MCFMNTIKVILESQGSNSNFISELIKSLIPLVSALAGIIIGGFINNRITIKTLRAKANEPEIQEIRDSIRSFYQPILLLLRKNKKLYDMFSYGKPEGFRTLVALLEGQTFTGNDANLLSEIIKIDKEINEIITTEKGKIKSKEISETLSKASVHFDVIEMAYWKNIVGEHDRFKNYVFPRELEDLIVKEIDSLMTKLEGLEKKWIVKKFIGMKP